MNPSSPATQGEVRALWRRTLAAQIFVIVFVLVAAGLMTGIYTKLERLVSDVNGQCISRQQAREVSRHLFKDALGQPLNAADARLLQKLPPLECP